MDNKLIQSDILKEHRNNLSAKTERIVTGVYLVSSLINDKEPLKWQLREKALKTLDMSHRGTENDLVSLCDDLIHLVSLANRSALISPMNAELLDTGIRALSSSVSNTPIADSSLLELPQQKEAPQMSTQPASPQIKDEYKSQIKKVLYKGQSKTPDKKTSNRKDKRRESIVEALSKKNESSIKDIARQVRGCSEKTIQRELNALISEGRVAKKGERRWSMYMLT